MYFFLEVSRQFIFHYLSDCRKLLFILYVFFYKCIYMHPSERLASLGIMRDPKSPRTSRGSMMPRVSREALNRPVTGGRGVVCTYWDIRSVNFFCFLKTSILQLGVVEHLKVRQECYRIGNYYF